MKKILVLLIMCFVLATSAFATEVNDYLDAKQAFEDAKFDYQECTKKCDELEAEVLDTAKDYLEASTDLVSSKLKGIKDYVDDETIDQITDDLLTLLDIPDEIDEATSKEDLQKVALEVAGIWSKYKDTVDEYNVEDYYNSVNEIYEKGDQLDDIIECSIEEAEGDVSNVELRYGAFDEKMDEVEEYLNSALEDLEDSPENATTSIGNAVTALGEADELLGKLMEELTDAEVALVEECDTTEADDDDDDSGDNDDDEADNDDDDDSGDNDDDDTVTDDEFDDLLDDADLDGDYRSALNEIEDAEELIDEKQDDCYVTTQAEAKLDEAYDYMDIAYQAVLDDDVGLAWTSMENAKSKAETAQLSAYFTAGTCSDDDDDDDILTSVGGFKECLEDAATSLYRNYCYADYDISEDQQDEIDECFLTYPSSEEQEECIDPIDDLDTDDSGDNDDDDEDEVTLEIEIEDFSYDGDSVDLESDITLKIEGTTYDDNDYDVTEDNGDLTIELEAVIDDNDDLTIDFEDEEGNEFQFKCRLLVDDEELKRVEFTIVAEDFDEDFEEDTVTFDFEGTEFNATDSELSVSEKEIEFENDEDEEFDFGSGLDFDIYGEDDDSDEFEYDGKITVDIT